MNLESDIFLENDLVLLRPLKESDFEELLVYSENEPEIWLFNALGADGTENLKKYITAALENKSKGIDYPFVVLDKKTNKIVGSTRYYAINTFNKTLEIGFTWYGKQYQGTGLNKNCKYLLLEYAFQNLGVERVGFRANNLNARSINAMKSIGCKEEGVLRNFAMNANGERIDAIVLSIIKNEWFNEVKNNLKNKISNYAKNI
ncbi:MAG: GNAT family protein [Limnohabitans sp.]|nr:GNAT family protein [Limnohabitans sp.]